MAETTPPEQKNAANSAASAPDGTVAHSTWPALVMSMLLHVILLTTLGIILSQPRKGTGDAVDRPVGIAIVHKMPDRDRYVDAAEQPSEQQKTESTNESSNSSAQAAAAPPADMSPPIDLTGVLNAMQSLPAPVAGTGLAGDAELGDDSFGDGRSKSSNSDGQDTTTVVFGVSGSGSRFVYVFDRSDSMNGHGGRPLRAAKAELLRSIRSLTERQRFQIVFYNDKAKPFRLSGMPLQMVPGEPSNLTRAERYISSIAAFGGTEHDVALKMALKMSPDVIFFLTDARIPRLSGAQLAEIRRRCSQAGTTIHAIEFGADAVEPVDSFLKDLAAQNNGEYRYIDVRNLGRARPAEVRP